MAIYPIYPGSGGGGSGEDLFDNLVVVKTPQQLSGTLDSTKQYFIDGIIDFTGTGLNITIPSGGLSLKGYNFDNSLIFCEDDNYKLFVSPPEGSGNLVMSDLAISVSSFVNSQVYDIRAGDDFRAIELNRINYDNCGSLGEIADYRQGFESGMARFGGRPNLTLTGPWTGGFVETSSIVRLLDSGMTGALFQAGAGFTMQSRFRSDMNVDLPANAALFDFSSANFPNPSTVQINGAIVTRNGVQDATDTNLTPNMDAGELSAQWKNNVGLDNTYEGGRSTNTAESTTVISVQGTYYDISGTNVASNLEHFDNPAGFELRHLGNNPRDFNIIFDAVIDSSQNAELSLKFEKWDDSAGVFVDVGEQTRPVNNLAGGRDVAFFNGQFPIQLDQNDFVKWTIANLSGTANVTLENDSFFLVSER